MRHNMYWTESSNTDLQKIKEEAQTRLSKHNDETTIHYHKATMPCEPFEGPKPKHEHFVLTEGYE